MTTINAANLRPGDIVLPTTPGWPGTCGAVRAVRENYPNNGTGFRHIIVTFWFRKYVRSFAARDQIHVTTDRSVR
jgi:hypothetical protein